MTVTALMQTVEVPLWLLLAMAGYSREKITRLVSGLKQRRGSAGN